jgi:hypothetical protein
MASVPAVDIKCARKVYIEYKCGLLHRWLQVDMIFKIQYKHSLLHVIVYTVVTYKTELAGKNGRNPELQAGRQAVRRHSVYSTIRIYT